MFDNSTGLKTSKCQCSVMDIAPPAGSRLELINDFDVFSIFTFLNALLTVPVILKPPVGGAGCEVPSIAACSFNLKLYL